MKITLPTKTMLYNYMAFVVSYHRNRFYSNEKQEVIICGEADKQDSCAIIIQQVLNALGRHMYKLVCIS